jgi:FAD/FMN-containing dehydrogenase
MPDWSNWSGRHRLRTQRLHFLRSEADAVALAASAARDGLKLRTAGAGHSHAPLVPCADLIVDAQALAGVISIDPTTRRAWVGAGTRIHSLGAPLSVAGLGLHNQGDIDQQAIAGATATGTHGTGVALRNLSSAVTGMRIATAGGELVTASAEQNRGLWQAARLHLGAFGIVTALELQLRDAYRLKEHSSRVSIDEVLPRMDTLISGHRHFEFFWYPQNDVAFVKTIDETQEPAVYPLADEGSRLGWSHEVLPNHRPHKHTEMEYSVPAEHGIACFNALRELLTSRHRDVAWPVEFRTLAADDVWLSTAYERPTVTLSVHQTTDADETDYYRDCEAIFRHFDGRPHWGKMHYLDSSTLRAIHPRWDDWWRVRDAIDPNRTFLNSYLEGLSTSRR